MSVNIDYCATRIARAIGFLSTEGGRYKAAAHELALVQTDCVEHLEERLAAVRQQRDDILRMAEHYQSQLIKSEEKRHALRLAVTKEGDRIRELLSARYNQAEIKDADVELANALRGIIQQLDEKPAACSTPSP